MLEKGKQTCHTRVSTIQSLNKNMRHQVYSSDTCRTTISESSIPSSYPGAEVFVELLSICGVGRECDNKCQMILWYNDVVLRENQMIVWCVGP